MAKKSQSEKQMELDSSLSASTPEDLFDHKVQKAASAAALQAVAHLFEPKNSSSPDSVGGQTQKQRKQRQNKNRQEEENPASATPTKGKAKGGAKGKGKGTDSKGKGKGKGRDSALKDKGKSWDNQPQRKVTFQEEPTKGKSGGKSGKGKKGKSKGKGGKKK